MSHRIKIRQRNRVFPIHSTFTLQAIYACIGCGGQKGGDSATSSGWIIIVKRRREI